MVPFGDGTSFPFGENEPAAGVPEGFRDLRGEKPTPMLTYEDLERGGLVRYDGTGKSYGGTLRHYFITDAGHGLRFGLWGSADLNRKLSNLPANVVLYVRYDGKQQHPEDPQKELHGWTVARSSTSQQAENARAQQKGATEALELLVRQKVARDGGPPPARVDQERGK